MLLCSCCLAAWEELLLSDSQWPHPQTCRLSHASSPNLQNLLALTTTTIWCNKGVPGNQRAAFRGQFVRMTSGVGGLVAPMLAKKKRGRRPANLPCCPLMSHPDLTLDLTTYLKPTQLTHMGDFHFTRCSINQSLPWGANTMPACASSKSTDRNNSYI